MPRSKTNTLIFEAGALPKITFNNQQYYVDGRLEELRNTNNFNETLFPDDDVWNKLSQEDQQTIVFEFYGTKL